MLNNFLGKPELRDTIDKNATSFVQSLEHHYRVPFPAQICGSRDSCRTGSDDGNFLARFRGNGRNCFTPVLTCIIGNKSFDTPNRHRFIDILIYFSNRTILLALALLGTDTTTNGRKKTTLLDDIDRLLIVTLCSLGNETGNIYGNGTALDTRLVLALQAPQGLGPDLAVCIPEGNFLHIGNANGRILGRHFLHRNLPTFPCRQGNSIKLFQNFFCLEIQFFNGNMHGSSLSFGDVQANMALMMGFLFLALIGAKA